MNLQIIKQEVIDQLEEFVSKGVKDTVVIPWLQLQGYRYFGDIKSTTTKGMPSTEWTIRGDDHWLTICFTPDKQVFFDFYEDESPCQWHGDSCLERQEDGRQKEINLTINP